jgi:hypothetical protein
MFLDSLLGTSHTGVLGAPFPRVRMYVLTVRSRARL